MQHLNPICNKNYIIDYFQLVIRMTADKFQPNLQTLKCNKMLHLLSLCPVAYVEGAILCYSHLCSDK